MLTRSRLLRGTAGLLLLVLGGCGSDNPIQPRPSPTPGFPGPPILVSPLDGAQVDSDTPTFVVRNAGPDFGLGQATYTFEITSRTAARPIQSFNVPAGDGSTSATAPEPLPRGMLLRWSVIARNANAAQTSGTSHFRLPPVACGPGGSPYAKRWVDWFVPDCSLQQNSYNDPDEVLGRPDACCQRGAPFVGFMSLGNGGYVDVDMQACATDRPGVDIRVWQSVSSEPVTLYAAGQPGGPWVRLRTIRNCGLMSDDYFSNYCDFDLDVAEIDEARYFRVEDDERTPCAMGMTDSEGADIDAVELLHQKP